MASVGDTLDRYELLQEIGSGGQAEVWRVRDPLARDAPRVVKLFAMGRGSDASAERIRREARLLASLEHPCLVRCHALFEDLKRRKIGLVLDYVDGMPLSDALRDKRWSAAAARVVLARVTECLAFIHDRGVVHRDLKPDNILLGSRFFDDPRDASQVRVIDLGIAVEQHNQKALTREGMIVGTLPYIAPEVIAPHRFDGSRSSPAVDVFSLGVLAWEILVGGHPTGLAGSATAVQLADAYVNAAGRSTWGASAAPEPWGSVLLACLALDPAQRCPDARRVLALLGDQGAQALARIVVDPGKARPAAPDAPLDTRLATTDTERTGSRQAMLLTAPKQATSRDAAASRPRPLKVGSALLALLVLAGAVVALGLDPWAPRATDSEELSFVPATGCYYERGDEGLTTGGDVDTTRRWAFLRAGMLRVKNEATQAKEPTHKGSEWQLYVNGAPAGRLGAEKASDAPRVVLDDLAAGRGTTLLVRRNGDPAAEFRCTASFEPKGPLTRSALEIGVYIPCFTEAGEHYVLSTCLAQPRAPR